MLFVWDFHGTLERDNVLALQLLVNETLRSFGIAREMTLDVTVELYGLSWIDYFHHAYPEGDIEMWHKMKEKAIEIQKKEKYVERYIKPMNFAAETLGMIKVKGHKNILMSNSAPDWIKIFAKLVELQDYFDDYIALDSHDKTRKIGDTEGLKIKALKEYVKKQKYTRIIKIGDRESDIEAGKAVGAVTYFFRNQFNQKVELSTKPDHDISDLRDVLQELEI